MSPIGDAVAKRQIDSIKAMTGYYELDERCEVCNHSNKDESIVCRVSSAISIPVKPYGTCIKFIKKIKYEKH